MDPLQESCASVRRYNLVQNQEGPCLKITGEDKESFFPFFFSLFLFFRPYLKIIVRKFGLTRSFQKGRYIPFYRTETVHGFPLKVRRLHTLVLDLLFKARVLSKVPFFSLESIGLHTYGRPDRRHPLTYGVNRNF